MVTKTVLMPAQKSWTPGTMDVLTEDGQTLLGQGTYSTPYDSPLVYAGVFGDAIVLPKDRYMFVLKDLTEEVQMDWATVEEVTAIYRCESMLPVGGGSFGSILLTTTGEFYATREDLELIFGKINVTEWADIDSESDPTFILDRITTMVALAQSHTVDALRGGPYTLPGLGDPIPMQLTYHVAALAGVLLYESRGVQDYDNNGRAEHQLTFQRKRWEQFVDGVNKQSIKLDLPTTQASNAPAAY